MGAEWNTDVAVLVFSASAVRVFMGKDIYTG